MSASLCAGFRDRAGMPYAASAWLLVQIVTQVCPFFHIAESLVRWIAMAALTGFTSALLFPWFYEGTATTAAKALP